MVDSLHRAAELPVVMVGVTVFYLRSGFRIRQRLMNSVGELVIQAITQQLIA